MKPKISAAELRALQDAHSREVATEYFTETSLKIIGQAFGIAPDRIRELAEADKAGRLFLLPLESGRPMLCQEYFERPWVMKNVTLCVQYQSSCGIIYYMGYDVFRDLVERGRIAPLSPEGEKTLKGEQT